MLYAGHSDGCGLPMMLTIGPKGHLVRPRELCAGGGSAQSGKAAPLLPYSHGD